jgi:phosphate transport system permease protein
MAVWTNDTAAARPVAAPLRVFSTRFARRKLFDQLARHVVRMGGVIIIGSILAILLVIIAEAYPLLRSASARRLPDLRGVLDGRALAVQTDEYRTVAVAVTEAGLRLVDAEGSVGKLDLPAIGGAHVTSVSTAGIVWARAIALGLSDGRVLPLDIAFRAQQGGERRTAVYVNALDPVAMDPTGGPIRLVAFAARESASVVVAASNAPRVVFVTRTSEETSLLGATDLRQRRDQLELGTQGAISAIAVDERGDDLFIGTDRGELVRVDLRSKDLRTLPPANAASRTGVAITAIGFVLGDRRLVIGDAAGGVATWQPVRDASGEPVLARIHEFALFSGPVSLFAPSLRHKGFWVGDSNGTLRLEYSTTGQTLLHLAAGAPLSAIGFAPKADGLVAVDATGRLLRWNIDCPHPEVSLRALFGKVWYEGYDRPEYVWQSTGGTDDFEAKFSLTPLLFGTLKGTLYALLFAVPVALGGALYASQFMHPRLKGIVKPSVEVMAALPSVVLGFMAGLWLAPNVERVIPGLFLSPFIVGALVLVTLSAWRALPGDWRSRLRPGAELLLVIPIVLAGLGLAFAVGRWLEETLLGGDYRSWLQSAFGVTYDQRNSIVVGLAMGFAVIPVIFTIAEDSLSNVPPHLTAGSLALGANRWQTAVRVVLPSASPGIFSAVMIGFGRAVGETMIVLMATGNTPLMSWSAFNGFRALSANVAVELPEAPQGGTLFRVLFVAALLLFVMTFLVNTAAELIRQRLRQRYRTL